MARRWRFRPIDEPTGHRGPAVYKVRLLADGEVQPIARFMGTDRSGILQIGVSGGFEGRRKQFVSGLARCNGHSEANLLHMLLKQRGFRRRIGRFELEIAFQAHRTKQAAVRAEETLIRAYLHRFGEVPPLNTAIPNRYGG